MNTAPHSIPSEILRRGSLVSPLPVQPLRAGLLTLLYEAGALRTIRYGATEVVRMIYAAVRDENWLTIAPRIEQEIIQPRADSFEIQFEAFYQRGEIDFAAHYTISGSADGCLVFALAGAAQRSFRKNRIGLCVLHPIRECAGHDCEITHSDGTVQAAEFPFHISPHQPFFDIQAMRWHPSPQCQARLQFEGEVFETEDQRNWTDASFKTYCTPLARPFPVAVTPGERVTQRVTLCIQVPLQNLATNGLPGPREAALPAETINFALRDEPACPLPSLGLSRSSGLSEAVVAAVYGPMERAALRALNLSHLRVDVRPFERNWQADFAAAQREAQLLELPLELALFLSAEPERELQSVVAAWRLIEAPVKSVIVLHRDHKATPLAVLETLVPMLKVTWPEVAIGGGTDAYFAELNRNSPVAASLDFLVFSANPQVHAEDDRSLIENLEGLAEVLSSARILVGNRRVFVSPITLKPRANPDATGELTESPSDQLPPNVDARQMSLLGAGWTLGSLKYLCEAGADSVTFYETLGWRGVLQGQQAAPLPRQFPAPPGMVFPLYFVLREVLGSLTRVVPSNSSAPLRVTGLALRAHGNSLVNYKIVLANLTPDEQCVHVIMSGLVARLRVLDEVALERYLFAPDAFINLSGTILNAQDGCVLLVLPPFAVAVLESQNDAAGENA